MLRGLLALLNLTGIPRLVFRLMLDRRVPLGVKLILPAAVAYIIAPFDLVPDILPALGRIDDVLVLLISIGLFLAMAPRHVVAEHTGRRVPGGAGGPQPGQTVVEGEYRIIDDGEEDRR